MPTMSSMQAHVCLCIWAHVLTDAYSGSYRMDCIGVDAYTAQVTFGARVRWYREERGWSQAELARRADIDGGTVNRIEHSKIKQGVKTRRNIAKALGIPVAALDSDSPPPTKEFPRHDTSAFARLDDSQLLNTMAALISELERRQSRPPPSDTSPSAPPDEPPTARGKRR